MQATKPKGQFSLLGLVIATTLVALFFGIGRRNYIAIKQDWHNIPFSALWNFFLVWFVLSIIAFASIPFSEKHGFYYALLIFLFASVLMATINFLAPMGSL